MQRIHLHSADSTNQLEKKLLKCHFVASHWHTQSMNCNIYIYIEDHLHRTCHYHCRRPPHHHRHQYPPLSTMNLPMPSHLRPPLKPVPRPQISETAHYVGKWDAPPKKKSCGEMEQGEDFWWHDQLPRSLTLWQKGSQKEKTLISWSSKNPKTNGFLVVGSTRLKNMLVKLDHFPR